MTEAKLQKANRLFLDEDRCVTIWVKNNVVD